MSSSSDCSICCNKFNNTSQKAVSCIHCNDTACRACVKQYIGGLFEEAKCMFCSKPWTRSFIGSVMTNSYLSNEYKRHREDIVFDREQSTLPAMQPYLQAKKRMKQCSDRIKEIDALIPRLKHEKWGLLNERDRNSSFFDGRRATPDNTAGTATDDNADKTFITRGHCPKENCNGFIDEGWKCAVCDTAICSKCMDEKIDEGHVCDGNTLATIKQIRKDSKPCPSCRVRVYRIHGCSQMWCTNCNTAFCWSDLKILNTRFFHNPHYAEWVSSRRNTNAPRDIEMPFCGNDIVHRNIADACEERYGSRRWDPYRMEYIGPEMFTKMYNKISTFLNDLNDRHARYVLNQDEREEGVAYRTAKVKYLMGEMDKEKLKITVQRIDKRVSFKREFCQIVDMYTRVCKDILLLWCRKELEFEELHRQVTEVRNFTTKSMCDLKKWYNCGKNTYQNVFALLNKS